MSYAELQGTRGTTISYRLAVTLEDNSPYDITQAHVEVLFTAKRSRKDLLPLIQMDYRSDGGSDPGMTVPTGELSTLDIEIPAGDTAGFTVTEFLVWDAILTKPDGSKSRIAYGTLVVFPGVGT